MRQWMWMLGLGLAALVASAIAQPPGDAGGRGGPGGSQAGGPEGGGGRRPPSPIVTALDVDHDGIISADELKNAAAALAALDKNKDGKLTDDEFRSPRPGGAGERGPAGSSEGERRGERGSSGSREGQRGPGGMGGGQGPGGNPERMLTHAFEFDADGDGKLAKDEMAKFIADFIEHRPAGREDNGGGPPRGGEGAPPNGGSGRRSNEGNARPDRPTRPE